MKSSDFGVIWFDDHSATTGWAFSPSSGSIPVSSYAALPSNVLWFSNCSHKSFMENGFGRIAYLKSDTYFKVKLSQVAQYMGVHGSSSKVCAEIIHSFITQLFTYTPELSIENLPPYQLHQTFSSTAIPIALQRPASSDDADSSMIDYALKNATQHSQGNVGVRFPKGSKAVSFFFQKGAFFHHLFNTMVPVKNYWKKHKLSKPLVLGRVSGELVGSHSQSIKVLKGLVTSGNCGLVNISVRHCNPSISKFYMFGVTGFFKSPQRTWATIDEAVEIANFQEVQIDEIIYTKAQPLYEVLKPSKASMLNPAYGIHLEIMIKALADNMGTHTAISPFITAKDRIICGRAATALYNGGALIGSFGSGIVSTYLNNPHANTPQNDAIFTLAHSLGLRCYKMQGYKTPFDEEISYSPLPPLPTELTSLIGTDPFQQINFDSPINIGSYQSELLNITSSGVDEGISLARNALSQSIETS